jgi:hypothetical protein
MRIGFSAILPLQEKLLNAGRGDTHSFPPRVTRRQAREWMNATVESGGASRPKQTPVGGLMDGRFSPVHVRGLGAVATNKQRRV